MAKFDSPDVTYADVKRGMEDAGFFAEGSHFIIDRRASKSLYVDAAKAYKDVVDRFPFLAGELMGFGEDYKSSSANAGCRKDPGDQAEIILNYDIIGKTEEFRKQRETSERYKWHVPVGEYVSAERATITHEIGHAVVNWLHRAVYGEFKKSSYGYYTVYDNEVATLLKKRTMKALGIKTYNEIKEEVSEYAAASRTNRAAGQAKSTTKADEFFAECFCELMCSPKPRRAALEFGRQLDLFIKENNIDAMTTANTPSTKPRFEE